MSMKFRGIDGDGDWRFGNGQQSFFTDEAAINANVRTKLLVFLGECFFALQLGVDWWNIIGAKNPGAQAAIILQTRTIISGCYGVVKITSISLSQNQSRHFTLTYNIDTIFTRNVTQSVQLPS